MMKIDILTLFPEMFKGPFDESIIKRAQKKGLIEIKTHDLRNWTKDKRKTVDDRPFGGGTGMILMVEPIYKALRDLKNKNSRVILMDPRGRTFNQKIAENLAKEKHLIFICGHYEGIDERVKKHLVDEEISIGDYVLTGGELPAMIIIDTLIRQIPGVLAKPEASNKESFSENLLEYPQYTRPANFQRRWKVPEVLLSGDHKKIDKWRQKRSLEITKKRRPDLLRS
ncbi:tRNA (guanosine(37)-N1)-methyltransferase TrmD [Patescibacteria group bacterium]|nr:tRNA (guanosine(37)-N1)-methyltransferase TrmD [Patescibacteria group bacterium]